MQLKGNSNMKVTYEKSFWEYVPEPTPFTVTDIIVNNYHDDMYLLAGKTKGSCFFRSKKLNKEVITKTLSEMLGQVLVKDNTVMLHIKTGISYRNNFFVKELIRCLNEYSDLVQINYMHQEGRKQFKTILEELNINVDEGGVEC